MSQSVAEDRPPRFVIDLSQPPRERYNELVKVFHLQIQSLPGLFDVVVKEAKLPLGLTRRLAQLCLRRVHNLEEQQELLGISQKTGIAMYLLVAFNVLLDLFMGCTSGGVLVRDNSQNSHMMHFRTLDWGMDPLRDVMVQLDYVRRPGDPILASCISYAGYVGILTGVRPRLSISLNFRPCHDQTSRVGNFRFYFHHLAVLLGFRPSISSILRHVLLASAEPPSLDQLAKTIPSTTSTAAYLVLCDGEKTLVLEKDRIQAHVISSEDFVVVTNHDAQVEERSEQSKQETVSTPVKIAGMELLVEDSIDRKQAMSRLRKEAAASSNVVTESDVVRWLTTPPVLNEETHFATLMDPASGEIRWLRQYTQRPGSSFAGQC